MESTGDDIIDEQTGNNCIMRKTTYVLFARNILQFEDGFFGFARSDAAIINAALLDLTSLVQTYQVRKCDACGDSALLGTLLCRFILFFTSPLVLSLDIIKKVWGNQKIFGMFYLKDVDDDIRLVRRRLLSIQKMLINYMHIWTNGDVCILPNEMLLYLPASIRALILLNKPEKAVTYRGEYSPDGQEKIDLIMYYANKIDRFEDASYEDVITEWFSDFLVNGAEVDDDTGKRNGIFEVFGIEF